MVNLPNTIAGVKLPGFNARILDMPTQYEVDAKAIWRTDTIPAKCARYFINKNMREAEANKHPHSWIPFTACFNHNTYHAGSMAVSPEDLAVIPNWSWCNKCGVLDTNRPICEKYVFTSSMGGNRCPNRAAYHEQEFRSWWDEKEDPDGENTNPWRWWCKTHAPSVRQEKRSVKAAIRAAETAAYQANRDRQKERDDARNELQQLALETMEWLEKSGLKDEDEWARTLHKRIAAAKDKL